MLTKSRNILCVRLRDFLFFFFCEGFTLVLTLLLLSFFVVVYYDRLFNKKNLKGNKMKSFRNCYKTFDLYYYFIDRYIFFFSL